MPNEEGNITVFAKTNFRNREVPFGIKTDDRRRHMYVIGKTGMGKTTLMENMVIQDIRNGHGVAFLDPHGDSVQKILDCVPNHRVNDVVYFNPADLEYPIAFNILEAVDTKYKHLVASGLMGVFTKIWANLWSARMEYILNNTILALLDSPGNTLLGITRMYVDKKYRKKIVDNVKDPMVRAFWIDEFANYNEKYRTEAIAPIQNKVGQFLSSGIIRNIVGQPKSTIDLRDIMDNNKILIMDLSKGRVGEDNSALLGAMLVTKLQLAAMSRTDIPERERKDFYLYVDEFQNFATESFATILSEARKYRLNLIVGHQYIAQLEQDKSTKVRDAIFGNVGTMVVFRVGAADAEFLETEFEPIFTPNDLVNLPKYSIILKLMINGVASEPFSAQTIPPTPDWITGNAQKVIKVSRERYANPVADVEDKISRWMGAEFHQEAAVLIGTQGNSEEAPIQQVEQTIHTDKEIVIQTPQILQQTIETPQTYLETPPTPIQETEDAEVETEAVQVSTSVPEEAPVHKPGLDFSHFGTPVEEVPERKPSASVARASEQPSPQKQGWNARSGNHAGGGNRMNHSRPQNHQNHNGYGNKLHPGHSANHPARGSNHKPKNHQAKKDNPIWDTVANLRNEKVKETGEKISEVVKHTIVGHAEVQNTRPDPLASLKREVLHQEDMPDKGSPSVPQRRVLKPGSHHKF